MLTTAASFASSNCRSTPDPHYLANKHCIDWKLLTAVYLPTIINIFFCVPLSSLSTHCMTLVLWQSAIEMYISVIISIDCYLSLYTHIKHPVTQRTRGYIDINYSESVKKNPKEIFLWITSYSNTKKNKLTLCLLKPLRRKVTKRMS